MDFSGEIFSSFSMNPLPRKTDRVKMTGSVPQTDTSGLLEYSKANG